MEKALTLKKARELNQLEKFARQQDAWLAAQGYDAPSKQEVEDALATVIKHETRSDRTSRSPSGGGSTEK